MLPGRAGLRVRLLLLLLFFGFFGQPAIAQDCANDATSAIEWAALPPFGDDAAYQGILSAIDRSLAYLQRLPRERRFRLCDEEHSPASLNASLFAFKELIESTPSGEDLNRLLRERFRLCRATGRDADGRILVTGYFEPLFRGSLVQTREFSSPLYRRPPDLVTLPASAERTEKILGRIDQGRLIPYWTRKEIEAGALPAGLELAYLRDPLDVFVLQVQGSGRIELPDGSQRRVQFAEKNGHPYRSIGRFLADQGHIPLEEISMPRILAYLRNKPEIQKEVLEHNSSYVFFRWGEDDQSGPLGSLGEPLTAGRSVALDQSCFPPATLGYLESFKPIFDQQGAITDWQPFGRFVLNQDSGSAIKGPGRLDLFMGAGAQAEGAAGEMRHPGNLYFLVMRKEKSQGLE